jgi:5-methylcytosine-specific restriction endonuclease McrA
LIVAKDWADPEVRKTYQREYKRKHKARLAQAEKARYRCEKAHRLRRQKAYYAENREKVLEYHVEYHQRKKADPEYKEKGREAVNRRRARQRGAFKENVERQKVWERDVGVCGICGEPAQEDDWHLDHIVPLGPGEHCYENVRVAHPTCNIAKGAEDKRVLAEWEVA